LPAHSTFYVGGAKTFQTVVTTIAGIEVTAHAQAAAATNTHFPKTQNVRAVADPKDPGFVSAIEGEVVNDSPNQVLGGGLVYAVAVNASGAILGGNTGGVAGPAPPGARLFFKIASTSSIPIDQATSIQVSVVPSYRSS